MIRFKKRISIIAVWLIFLVLINFLFFGVESLVYHEKAQDELLDLSVTVAGQIPVLLENDYYTKTDASRMEYAKLKALSIVLEDTDNILDEKSFLEEFEQIANIEGLAVYDQDANVVMTCGDVSRINPDPAVIRSSLSSRLPDRLNGSSDITEDVQDRYLSTRYITDETEGIFGWITDNNKWLIVSKQRRTETEERLLDYFSWNNVLSKITIGRTGFVLAVADEDGIVLSAPERDRIGRSVEEMDIRIGNRDSGATLTELLEAFQEPNQIQTVRIGKKLYYANRLQEDFALMLALYPEDEIRDNIGNAASIMVILVILISGIAVLFASFHIQDTEDFKRRPKKLYAWNSVLAGRLKIMAVLTCVFLFVCGIYLEALSAYAETFRYTSNKVDRVLQLLKDNASATELLSDWFGDEYLTKCGVAECILDHTAPEKITRDCLSKLSASLDVQSVYVYDIDGNIRFTDSPYSRDVLKSTDPFYALLKGRPELVGDPENDSVSGKSRQRAGISLLDQNNECTGLLMIVTDPTSLEHIKENLGFSGVYEQISLKNDSFVMVIRNSDMTILYLAEVEDGRHKTGLDSYDYSGYPISELGISEMELRDHYNGNLFILHNRYFASVRRVGDYYLLVMRPQIRFTVEYLNMVIIAAVCTLIFIILLIFLSCLEKKERAIEESGFAARAAAARKKLENRYLDELKHRDDDVFGMLGSLINKKKPYFEQRWPEDCIKWKDKTTSEKFTVALKYFMILALSAIFIHALTSGEGSIWYYCLNGQWDSGINLYSVTYCLITICGLFVIKMVMHKVLFLTARAVNARGETFCHLLDSFSGYALVIAGIFLCLSHFGVSSATLSLTGGVAGVIFGIGCQNIVADILAGILMACEGIVYVGDFVSYNGQYGIVLSIGVRTTILKWYGENTIVRNNEFKNYINMPSGEIDRVLTTLTIDLNESLERVEKILNDELPVIHDHLCKLVGNEVEGPKYRGVNRITENGIDLSFAIFCKGMYYAWLTRALNRELKLMCERRGINIAMNQVVVNEPKSYPDPATLMTEDYDPGKMD